MNPQTLAVARDFTDSVHCGVVSAVVKPDGPERTSAAVFRIKFHLRTLEAWETGENSIGLVGDPRPAYTCLLVLNGCGSFPPKIIM